MFRLRRGLVAVALASLALAGCTSANAATTVTTAPVQRATITTGVTAVGSLTSASSVNLGFASGGQLTAVTVQVGDKVTAGQVLARVDDFVLRQLVRQQKANLAQQRAVLSRISKSPAVSGAKSTLSQARAILSATRSQVAATGRADSVSIDRSNAALDAANTAVGQIQAAISAAEAAGAGADSLATAKSALATAQQGVVSATTGVATSEQKKKVDAAAGQVSIATVQQSVVAAQNSEKSLASDKTYNIQQQQAAVTAAQTLVAIAEKNLANATLTAPFAGTVTAINGAVGEYVSAANATTAQAPGTDAAIPGTTLLTGTSVAARPGGSQFLVLASSAPMKVVVPFQEMDAASMVAGQKVSVALDALPDLSLTGKVTAIAPSATSTSGAMSYYVTMTLDGTDARLKEGMTVRATVHTAEADNVLSVPTSAVHTQNGQAMVLRENADGTETSVVIVTGLVGADLTEVKSGLAEGDQVVVSGVTK